MTRKPFLWGIALCHLAVSTWLVLRWSAPGIGEPESHIDTTKANFDRINVGMMLEEGEAILGNAGLRYSSDSRKEYYIWKTRKGWISVFVEQGRFTDMHLNPELSMDD
jgi:hypothetical protein